MEPGLGTGTGVTLWVAVERDGAGPGSKDLPVFGAEAHRVRIWAYK